MKKRGSKKTKTLTKKQAAFFNKMRKVTRAELLKFYIFATGKTESHTAGTEVLDRPSLMAVKSVAEVVVPSRGNKVKVTYKTHWGDTAETTVFGKEASEVDVGEIVLLHKDFNENAYYMAERIPEDG